jgi:hypothetical protein
MPSRLMTCSSADVPPRSRKRPDVATVALHEAAYATIFVRLGLRFARVELRVGDPCGVDGAMFGRRNELMSCPEKYLVGLLAGTIAESIWTGEAVSDVADEAGAIDFTVVDDLGAHLTPHQADALIQRAHRLVHRNAGAISQVAVELLRHRHLTEADVHRIIRKTGPVHDRRARPPSYSRDRDLCNDTRQEDVMPVRPQALRCTAHRSGGRGPCGDGR